MINEKSEQELIEDFKKRFVNQIRVKRNEKLLETDYIFLPDVEISEDYKQKILIYRQKLRDFPEVVEKWLLDKDWSSVDVNGAPWPVPPGGEE